MIWVDTLEMLSPPPASVLSEWVSRPTILSQALDQVFPNRCLVVKSQGEGILSEEEQRYLQTSEKRAWIREIHMDSEGKVLTYGRVSMPYTTYQHHQQMLDSLGDKPIGKTLLYNNPLVERSAFSFTLIHQEDPCYPLLQKWDPSHADTWVARRSRFTWEGFPLIITEIFFPVLENYLLPQESTPSLKP